MAPALRPWQLAEACRLAYRRESLIQAWDEPGLRAGLAPLGLDLWGTISAGETQAYVAVADGIRYLVFRGTEKNGRDILSDLDFIKTADGVHRGFHGALELVWDRIVATLRGSSGPIYVLGHSLGGALATLAAWRLRSEGFGVAGWATFGSPRVGTPALADRLAGLPGWRYEFCCDVVPKVPFIRWGFRHVGTWCYVDRNGRLWIDPGILYAVTDQLASMGRQAWKGQVKVKGICAAFSRPFLDHRIAGYVEALQALEPK